MPTKQNNILAHGMGPFVLLFISVAAAVHHYTLHYPVLVAGLLLFAVLTAPAQLQTIDNPAVPPQLAHTVSARQ